MRTGKADKGDVDSALLDALCETAGSFPPGSGSSVEGCNRCQILSDVLYSQNQEINPGMSEAGRFAVIHAVSADCSML